MTQRAWIHVTGPASAGKTAFLERLLETDPALVICVRAERDAKLRKERESAPKTHAELRRFRAAGASAVALYRFARPDPDAFYSSDVLQDYSEAVFIEGDSPIDYVDLSVFIAPTPPAGRSLLRRVVRDHAAAHQASIEHWTRALENPEALVRLVFGGLDPRFAAMALKRPELLDDVRRSMQAKRGKARRSPPPAPTEHWALADGYEGIDRAQLVIVNIRDEQERPAAEAFLDELGRLRKDDAVFREIVGPRGNKVPITAVIANLSNRKDAGLKKAVTRVRRATKRSSP